MPRPKTILVDDAALLTSIRRCHADDLAALDAAIAARSVEHDADRSYHVWQALCDHRAARQEIADVGIRYDLVRFAGRALTPSERIRHQEAIRRLEAAGQVTRYGNRIKPTITHTRELAGVRTGANDG